MDFLPGPELYSKIHLAICCENTIMDIDEKIKYFTDMYFITFARTLPFSDEFGIVPKRVAQSSSKLRDYYMHSEIVRGDFVGHIDFEFYEDFIFIEIISYKEEESCDSFTHPYSEIFFQKLADYLSNVLNIGTDSSEFNSINTKITPEAGNPWEIIPDHLWHREAIKLWHQGLTYKQIGNKLGLSPATIKNEICNLRKEFDEIAVPYKRNIRKY